MNTAGVVCRWWRPSEEEEEEDDSSGTLASYICHGTTPPSKTKW
jgi:hypothetical protein